MTHRVSLQPSFILHRRPFSNSSWVLDVFTKDYGRLSMLARNARGLSSRYRGQLEMFFPLLIDFSGQRELKTLGHMELAESPIALEGEALLCGLYLNELMSRLIPPQDPYAEIFEKYYKTLMALLETQPNTQKIQGILRCFEKQLLNALGYGLPLAREGDTGEALQKHLYYEYRADCGFVRCHTEERRPTVFIGSSLLSFHDEQLEDLGALGDAKRLMRLVLPHYLGYRPLKSRDLLR